MADASGWKVDMRDFSAYDGIVEGLDILFAHETHPLLSIRFNFDSSILFERCDDRRHASNQSPSGAVESPSEVVESEDNKDARIAETILPGLENLPIPSLDVSDVDTLMFPITLLEVREAVFSIPKNSSLGPDGYHAELFQRHSSLVQQHIFHMNTSWKALLLSLASRLQLIKRQEKMQLL
ncbi:hypothetical protein K1719_024124 [Acacia pycnantha]|nr:hypothetical protein K1719_024124 [Acacia pycnantha]